MNKQIECNTYSGTYWLLQQPQKKKENQFGRRFMMSFKIKCILDQRWICLVHYYY